ncbi:MAG: ATP-binding protein [Smithellaceae bacterium]|nr:ATP-binding protein [Smithellaceae bacterium]
MVETNPNLYSNSFNIEGGNFNSAGIVSTNIKSILKKLGIPSDIVRKAAIVSYEAEINVVSYAKKAIVNLTVNPGVVQIEVIDEGPGIPNIDLAMQEGYSTADQRIREMGFGAGMGLCNIKNYSDVFHITSEVGKGTHLKMTIQTP